MGVSDPHAKEIYVDRKDMPIRIYRNVLFAKMVGFNPKVEFDGDKTWTISIEETAEDNEIALSIRLRGRKHRSFKTGVTLTINGEVEEGIDSITKAMLRLQGKKMGTQGTSAVEGASRAARTNSVAVRRASVIRT